MQATALRRLAASSRQPCLCSTGRRQRLPPRAPPLLQSAAPSRRLRLDRRRSAWLPAATAAPAPHGIPDASAAQPKPGKKRLAALLAPLSDPAANAKLLALCTAQMLGSVATLMHESYLAVYLTDVLHMTHTQIGSLQGAAQLFSKASGSVSGILADVVTPARMVILGAALTALNKPMYAASGAVAALAGTTACLWWVTFAKIFDRASKGIREAPSKALIGELAASSGDSPTAAFGLRQSMALLGASAGASVASLALALTGGNYPLTFALSTVPAVLALLLLSAAFGPGSKAAAAAAAKRAAEEAQEGSVGRPSLGAKARGLLGALRPAYWQALLVVAVLYLGRFDATFALLRAKGVLGAGFVPYLVPCVGITQVLLAAPLGLRAKSSVAARNATLLAGMAALIGADLCFAFVPSWPGILSGALLLGLHMAATHGVSVAMLSSYIPAQPVPGLGRLSGTAWALTDLLLGGVLAVANLLAGRLNDWTLSRGWGAIGCFLGGGIGCALSMALLAAFAWKGELGRDELLQGAGAAQQAPPAPPPAAASA